jgi:hypothetical protein
MVRFGRGEGGDAKDDSLRGEHLLVEVFSVTKFGKIFKKTSAM